MISAYNPALHHSHLPTRTPSPQQAALAAAALSHPTQSFLATQLRGPSHAVLSGPPGSAALQGGPSGSAETEQQIQTAQPTDELEDDPLPDLNPDDDELTEKLLSLPNIMCHAANGDVFLVGLK